MKRKILCIVLAVALAVSCFTLVQAADGDTLGGKLTAAKAHILTKWTGHDVSTVTDGNGNVATPTNTTVNTPFKGIDFPDADGVRTFKFVAYNDTDNALDIYLSCSWGTQAVANLTTKESPKDYTSGNSGGIGSRRARAFTLTVPNRSYWLNSGGTANGSAGKIVDGSGVGFRFNANNSTGSVYITCVGGDSTVTPEEVAKINENLGQLGKSDSNAIISSAITDTNIKDGLCKVAELGFAGVRYNVPAGTAQGYYKLITPDLSHVKAEGEDTVTAEFTVYNNSDQAVLVCMYAQASWADVKGGSKERVYLGAKTYHTFNVSYKTNNGMATNVNNKEVSVYGTDVFYRVDIEFQPDVKSGGNNTTVQDYDITVMNTGNAVYKSYSQAQDVLVAPGGYTAADTNLKTPMVMYNGDLEPAGGLGRWTMMQGGKIKAVESDNADGGNWALQYTSEKSIYGSALFNVAPAIANFTAKDGVFNGGGAGYYKLTFDAKADENAKGSYFIRLQPDGGGNNIISNSFSVNFTTEWQKFSGVITVTQSNLDQFYFGYLRKTYSAEPEQIEAAMAPIFLRFDGATGGLKNAGTAPGTYWIDNVKIEKVEFNANIEASITLNDSIAWNLYGEGIDKVDVTFNGNTTTVKFENGKAVFDDIAAKMMADKITFKFYQTIGGKEFTKEITTSVKEYMEKIISGSYGEAAKTLAIDTLNYGTATQVYDNYDVENLANAGLTDAQKDAYLSITKPASVYNQTGDGIRFKAASLYLKDKVYIKMYIAKGDYREGMTVKVNGTAELTEWKASGDYMYVMTDGISANELSNTVTAAVYEGETQVSATLTYSVGTYAANKWNGDGNLASLVKALVKYGNSAAAYTE